MRTTILNADMIHAIMAALELARLCLPKPKLAVPYQLHCSFFAESTNGHLQETVTDVGAATAVGQLCTASCAPIIPHAKMVSRDGMRSLSSQCATVRQHLGTLLLGSFTVGPLGLLSP